MSSSLYDIIDWGGKFSYKKNDVVAFPPGSFNFYYALNDHSRGSTDFVESPFSYDTTKWSNAKTDVNSTTQPHFIWIPSYSSEINQEPLIKSLRLGGGFQQTATDGINSDLLTLNLTFAARDLNETTAILHFLHQRKGQIPFVFSPPIPYQGNRMFTCSLWNTTSIFQDNFEISATFMEYRPTPYQVIMS